MIDTLSPHHRDHLRASAIPDALMDRMGLCSLPPGVAGADEAAKMLNWKQAPRDFAGALVFRFLDRDGKANCFCRLRFDRPRTDAAGKAIKYEQPVGAPFRAYFGPAAIEAAKQQRARLLLVEGEKKCLACEAAGIATIGLTGVFGWTKKRAKDESGRGKGERELIDDLASIDWRDRPVGIQFDFDDRKNPDVDFAACELARVLSMHGADPRLIEPPLGVRGPDGQWLKQGIDDYAVRCGLDAVRSWVDAAFADPPQFRTLEDWRQEMERARVESVGHSGIRLDTSPPGSGKTHADMAAAVVAERSLIVLPSHRLCRATAEQFSSHGLAADAYPELSRETCDEYDEAAAAIAAGLSPSSTICPGCVCASNCDYRQQVSEAESSPHRMATHARAEVNIASLAEKAAYVALHEDVAGLLAPAVEIASGFDRVAEVARIAGASSRDREDMTGRAYFWAMERTAEGIATQLREAADTTTLVLPAAASPPVSADIVLFQAMRSQGIFPPAEATRICRAATRGELQSLTIRVDRVFAPGQQEVIKKSVLGLWRVTLPDHCPVWLCDGTATREEIEELTGRKIVDATPGGRLAQRQPVIQLPQLDVKKGTAAGVVVKILRALFVSYPFQRVGILCHREHVSTITGTSRRGLVLDEQFRQRIAKVEYFRSGVSRGSNEWAAGCDALFVLGTPRVPPAAVRSRLIQRGNVSAAARDGRWDRDYWSGLDEAGRRHTIRTSGYRDHDWRSAHAAIVAAELIQSIGRGRAILAEGIPVIVASNESLWLTLGPAEIRPLCDGAIKAFDIVKTLSQRTDQQGELSEAFPTGADESELSEANPNIYLGFASVSSAEVATALGLSERQARDRLIDCESCGAVERIGERGGWRIRPQTAPSLRPGPAALELLVAEPAGQAIHLGPEQINESLGGQQRGRPRGAKRTAKHGVCG